MNRPRPVRKEWSGARPRRLDCNARKARGERDDLRERASENLLNLRTMLDEAHRQLAEERATSARLRLDYDAEHRSHWRDVRDIAALLATSGVPRRSM
jgi:hypothetical protein